MSVQANVNQLLTLTTGAVGLFGKPASEQELASAIEERDLAKSDYEKTASTLKEVEKNLSKEELQEAEEEGLPLISEMSPEKELEYKHKYGNKGIIGRHKLAKKYEQDKAAYEYNQAITQSYRNEILDKIAKDKQASKDSIKRAKEYRKDKIKQINEMKTSLGSFKNLDSNLQYKILEQLKKEEVNKK